ncbi:MAG: riboflavin synthase [Verrucomicrobiota bacterium]|mgnify:FL=1|jgi:riboflavin synthase|nr:riboflavin synthase [Verrucomicrobiota bacterium]|tara:strand:- start:570 stop:1169 length:600 start_codon:yes stop_codon:yes gene_type:complete
MFTGIIEETGTVESIHPGDKSIRLTLKLRKTGGGLKVGDSLAVNGCCLTVAELTAKGRAKTAQFDLLNETWNLTNLQHCRAGSLVNLERSLEAGGRLGGHFVTGHIDGVGKIITWEKTGDDHQLQIAAPEDVMRYVIHKGSIAVDGISLTVAAVEKGSFTIWIIPHTFESTALSERAVGDAVNLEADMLGKYVERFAAR